MTINKVPAVQVGPARNLMRGARDTGTMSAALKGILFVGTDCRQTFLGFETWGDIATLTADLLGQMPARAATVDVILAIETLKTWAEEQKVSPTAEEIPSLPRGERRAMSRVQEPQGQGKATERPSGAGSLDGLDDPALD